MNSRLLLPNKFKKIGWILLCPAVIAGVLLMATHAEPAALDFKVFTPFPTLFSNAWMHTAHANLANTITGMVFILGAMLVAFSGERDDDEYIASLRLSALLWAVLVNYILLFTAFLLAYDLAFFTVMVYNMFTILLLFIARFHYLLFKHIKNAANEE